MLGITFGTAAFLILSGMMLGFREYFIQRLINTTAHISIKAEEPVIEEHSLDPYFFPDTLVKWVVPPVSHDEPPHLEYPQGWFDRLDADENVEAYAPQITAQVLVNRGKLTRTITLIGVEAAKQVMATDVAGRHDPWGISWIWIRAGSKSSSGNPWPKSWASTSTTP